jgi:drug/metabolite transporter (DMT)-like permease
MRERLSMQGRVQAYIELVLAMAIAGSSVVVGKLVIATFPVFLASAVRFAIGCAILVPLLFHREGIRSATTRRDWVILFLQSLTGVVLFSIFLLYGLKFTNAAEAGIITSTTPAVVGIISFLFLKERLSAYRILGIGLAVCGVLLINVLGAAADTARGPAPLLGNLLVFGAVVGEALFTIFRKAASDTISPLRMATVVSLFGLLLFLPLGLYEATTFDFTVVGWMEWMPILYYGTAVTVVAFILWFRGVMKVPASTAAVFTGVMPVSAVLLSYLILQEPFAWSHVWGGLCVLAGLRLITMEPSARAAGPE